MKKILLFLIIFLSGITCVFSADVTIEAKKQVIKADANKGFFEGDVKVQVGDVKVQSPRAELDLDPATKKPSLATFFDNPYAYQEKGNKKHEIKADIIKVSLIKKNVLALGKSQSIMMQDRQPIVTITADSQEYDTRTKEMRAHKGVIINYEKAQTYSDEAYAVIDKNGDINYLELTGHVVMKEGPNVIKGDKFTYNPSKEEFQVSGNTSSDLTFEDGTKIYVEARYQQLHRIKKTVIAGGKVKIIYQDYIAQGPKAQLFTDEKTGKPNTVVFTGRSKITQNESMVEADRIKMIMKPKEFYADGNVKTSIVGSSEKDNMEFIN
jgi:lipopolysaccharide export system protein LptA